jgi:hypothetical protein
MSTFIALLVMAFLSGVCGRLGGVGDPYDTKWRDWGCSAIVLFVIGMLWGWHAEYWWVYVVVFLWHWGAFATYWDKLFGYDNFWFSGLVVGLGIAPLMIIDAGLWWVVLLRAGALCVIWGCLNKFLPQQVGPFKRDVVEEFSRYAASF